MFKISNNREYERYYFLEIKSATKVLDKSSSREGQWICNTETEIILIKIISDALFVGMSETEYDLADSLRLVAVTEEMGQKVEFYDVAKFFRWEVEDDKCWL